MLSLLLATVVNSHATVTLRAPEQLVVGQTNEVLIEFQVKPHWHIYWENPGDSGEEPRATWKVPADVKMGRFEYPIPQRLPSGPFTNFGFAAEDANGKPRVIPFRVAVEAAKPEAKTLSLSLTYLVCQESCVPEKAELQVTVPTAAAANSLTKERAKSSALAIDDSLFPKRSGEGSPATPLTSTFQLIAGKSDPVVHLAIPTALRGRDLSKIRFFPRTSPLLVASQPGRLADSSGTPTLEVALDSAVAAQDVPTQVQGLIVDEAKGDAVWVDFELAKPFNALALLQTIALAFLGGLLLNLMPCVFPVVSLKVLSFIREGHGDVVAIRRHAYAYTGGVVLSLWLLLAALFAVRAAGTSVGWGFQLQNPVFIFVMLAVFFLLALNLLGALEINYAGPARVQNLMMKRGFAGSFFTGFLTTVVATPCSAPFMGVAVGSALTGTVVEAFVVFTSLALGLALPYLVLALNPKWMRFLPKPGAWMETLKEFLAFPLFMTAVWLFWVLAQMVDVGALVPTLAWCVAAGFFAWARSRNFSKGARRMWVSLTAVLLVAATAFAILAVLPVADTAESHVGVSGDDVHGWGRYTDERLRAELAAGHSVFVDFTASWCVTCQVNKRLVLMTDAGAALFASQQVVRLRADWTKRDSEITNALSKLGRNSVPVYAFYRSGQAKPRLLPEILTPEILKFSLEEK